MSAAESVVHEGKVRFAGTIISILVVASSAFGQAATPAVFVANNGNLEGSIASFTIDPGNTLSFVGTAPAATNAEAIALSPDGRHLAVGRAIDAALQDLRIFRVNPDATLTQIYLGSVPTTPLDMVWLSSSKLAITETQLGGSFVHTYEFDASTPALTEIDSYSTGSFNSSLAFHWSQPRLYAQDSTGNTVIEFRLNLDGTLSLLGSTATGGVYPLDLTLTHDGSKLYAGGGISSGGDKILGYETATSFGDLISPLPGSPYTSPGASPAYLAVAGDDNYLFVGHGTDATVRSFTVHADGSLTSTGFSFDVGLQGSIGNVATLDDLLFVTDDTTAIDGVMGLYVFAIQPDGSFVQVGRLYDTFGPTPTDIVAWRPPCIGDIDGDGFRNVTDFTLLAQAFGTSFGDAEYNPAADLNHDWFINVTDFTQFASFYSTPCP